MALRPGRGAALGALLHAEEPIGVQPKRSRAEIPQRVQRVPDDQPHAGERRVEPVDRGLAVLEVVQVDPPPLETVYPGDRNGRAPIGVLDARFLEDHALEPAHDVAGPLQAALRLGVEVDRVPAGRHFGQQMPVLGRDLHHVIDARIVADLHLGQPEVGALAGVPRHDVVDDDAAVRGRHLAHPAEFMIRAE